MSPLFVQAMFGEDENGDYQRESIPVTVYYNYEMPRFNDESPSLGGYSVVDNDTMKDIRNLLPDHVKHSIMQEIDDYAQNYAANINNPN